MEVTLSVLQMALLSWAICVFGVLIGWFLAAWFTCAKIDDLEREIHKRDVMLAECDR